MYWSIAAAGMVTQAAEGWSPEVEERWLREPLPTYRIQDPYSLYRHVDGADRI